MAIPNYLIDHRKLPRCLCRMKGVYQHCAEKHLHRYLAEFDFRYSNRSGIGIEDAERSKIALKGISGLSLIAGFVAAFAWTALVFWIKQRRAAKKAAAAE
jgi:hypothetical protein